MSNTLIDKCDEDYSVNRLTTAQARQRFDDDVMNSLGITAEQFIKNYQAGQYENRDDCEIMSLLMMLPFTGYSKKYGNKQNICGK